uniref:Uncharacterized protein n=1 Tax=Helianthus annuus TaxID=4232 RepID=A0A251T1D9_HELAN
MAVLVVTSEAISAYSGDVWYPQPALKDHPWRYMPNQSIPPVTFLEQPLMHNCDMWLE